MQRFLLGSLRAPWEAVEAEVEALEQRLILDPDDSLILGNIALLPLDLAIDPEGVRYRHSDVLNAGLFTDYVIGTICGHGYSAGDTARVQTFKGERFHYGSGGRLIDQVLDPRWGWHTLDYDEDTDDVFESEDEHDTLEERDRYLPTVKLRCLPVEAEYYTAGLRAWMAKTPNYGSGPNGAKLFVIVTREDCDGFLGKGPGSLLLEKLGPSACTIMKAEMAAVFVVRSSGSSKDLYRRVQQYLPPNLVEDFIIFDIGTDIAAMRPGMSRLADWLSRSALVDEEQEPDALFDLQPYRAYRKRRCKGRGR